MTQLSFSDFEKNLQKKKSRKAEFLEILDRIVPWASLIALVSPYYPKEPTGSGRRPYPLESMVRIYLSAFSLHLICIATYIDNVSQMPLHEAFVVDA